MFTESHPFWTPSCNHLITTRPAVEPSTLQVQGPTFTPLSQQTVCILF